MNATIKTDNYETLPAQGVRIPLARAHVTIERSKTSPRLVISIEHCPTIPSKMYKFLQDSLQLGGDPHVQWDLEFRVTNLPTKNPRKPYVYNYEMRATPDPTPKGNEELNSDGMDIVRRHALHWSLDWWREHFDIHHYEQYTIEVGKAL